MQGKALVCVRKREKDPTDLGRDESTKIQRSVE